MNSHLMTELPHLLPLACAWANEHFAHILSTGQPLSQQDHDLATEVVVRRPELVRVALVARIPSPQDEKLKTACEQLHFLDEGTLGLTLGFGIYIKEAAAGRRLLAHELRHVAQYEHYPSIEAYLAVYIPELLQYGYEQAPFERDAREAEGRCLP